MPVAIFGEFPTDLTLSVSVADEDSEGDWYYSSWLG